MDEKRAMKIAQADILSELNNLCRAFDDDLGVFVFGCADEWFASGESAVCTPKNHMVRVYGIVTMRLQS